MRATAQFSVPPLRRASSFLLSRSHAGAAENMGRTKEKREKREKHGRRRRSDYRDAEAPVPLPETSALVDAARTRLDELQGAFAATEEESLAGREKILAELSPEAQVHFSKLEALMKAERAALAAYVSALREKETVLAKLEAKRLGISSLARLRELNSLPPPALRAVQAPALAWLRRRRWRSLAKKAAAATSGPLHRLYKRSKVLAEILDTERVFFNSLRTLHQSYYHRLGEALSPQEMNDIFLYTEIQSITTMSKTFLTMYRDRLNEWPAKGIFSDLFLTLVPMLKVYEKFCVKWEAALSKKKALLNPMSAMGSTDSLKRKDKTLKAAVERARKLHKLMEDVKQNRASGSDISFFLIQPVQRLPRYRMFLDELIKCTPECHIDYKGLVAAGEKMSEMVAYIDHQKTHAEQKELLNTLLKRQGMENTVFLSTGGPASGAGVVVDVVGAANLPSEASGCALSLKVGKQKIAFSITDKSTKSTSVALDRQLAFRLDNETGSELTIRLLRRGGKKNNDAIGCATIPFKNLEHMHADLATATWFSFTEDACFSRECPSEYQQPVVGLKLNVVAGDARATIRAGARPTPAASEVPDDKSSSGTRTPRSEKASEDSDASWADLRSSSASTGLAPGEEARHENPLFQLLESDPEEWTKLNGRLRRRLDRRCGFKCPTPVIVEPSGSPSKKSSRTSVLKSNRRRRSQTMDHPPKPQFDIALSDVDSEESEEMGTCKHKETRLLDHKIEPLSSRAGRSSSNSSSNLGFGSQPLRAEDLPKSGNKSVRSRASKRSSTGMDVDNLRDGLAAEARAAEAHKNGPKRGSGYFVKLGQRSTKSRPKGKSKRKKKPSSRSEVSTMEGSQDGDSNSQFDVKTRSLEGLDAASSLEEVSTRSRSTAGVMDASDYMDGRE